MLEEAGGVWGIAGDGGVFDLSEGGHHGSGFWLAGGEFPSTTKSYTGNSSRQQPKPSFVDYFRAY